MRTLTKRPCTMWINLIKLVRKAAYRAVSRIRYPGSATYWEDRYRGGGNSGAGSYGKFAFYKSNVINKFVIEKSVDTVIEFGCGDGNQLSLANYPHYIGFDVSQTAIDCCTAKFSADSNRSFKLMRDYSGERADLALSLDVIFHLTEDVEFERYMTRLFSAAKSYVIIYSSNQDSAKIPELPHVRHRVFTNWVEQNVQGWRQFQRMKNIYPYEGDDTKGSFSDFYVYERS